MDKLTGFSKYLMDKRHVQSSTARMYVYAVRMWLDTLDGNRPTEALAQEYVDSLKLSPSTVSLRAHAIMNYFRWKGTKVSLDCPPIRIGEPKYLSMPVFNRVVESCQSVLEKTLIVVLFDTAIRISELLDLEIDDIDRTNMLVSVIRKGGRREEVNISEKALDILDSWIRLRESKSKKVFMDLDYNMALGIVKTVGRRAKVEVHPHILRHTRAIQMLMSGAALHDVQMHLGHASITTTANIYGRFRAVDLRKRIPSW